MASRSKEHHCVEPPPNELRVKTYTSKAAWGRGFREIRRLLLFLILALMLAVAVRAAEVATAPEGIEFFEKKIRPLLVERCYKCHSAASEKLKGGLRLDSREGMIRGGETRSALIPGDPEKSLLVEAIGYENNELQMPPKKRLAQEEVADLVAWVKMGAPWPKGAEPQAGTKVSTFDLEKRRQEHWSWKPIVAIEPPSVKDAKWPVGAVDRFVVSKLNASNLKPAPPADKRTLIRRVFFDLIGLPPTPAEVENFVDDSSPKAFEKVVDRLLDSREYGERWARHWLDLVRYGETLGHEFDYVNFNAWRYRDYVIRAFNADVPYNEFVTEQIAGDLLANPRRHPTEGFNESVIGTGFYWLGQRVHSPVDVRLEEAVVVDNQIDVTAKTFLGLTVACARCHDHKFDAISTRDYYSLFGVLGSSRYAQRSIDPPEKLSAPSEELRSMKQELRPLIGNVWLDQASSVAAYLAAAREVGAGASSISLSNRCLAIASARQLNPTRLERWIGALGDKKIIQPDHALFAWTKIGLGTNQPLANSFREQVESVVSDLRKVVPHPEVPPAAETYADFSGGDFAGWSVEDEAFGSAPTGAGDFVVGDPKRPVVALLSAPSANSAAVSRRFEGVLRSPTFTILQRYAHILAGGAKSRLNVRVDNLTMIMDPIYGSLKRALDQESLTWLTVDLDAWKGHRAYLEFNDLITPDPTDAADRKYSDLAYAAVSRVVFSDDPTAPKLSAAKNPLIPLDELSRATSLEKLAELYQQATIGAVGVWTKGECSDDKAPAQIAWLDWLARNSLLDSPVLEDPASRRLAEALDEFRKIEESIPERARVLGMVEGTGLDENVFIRGNPKTLGEAVPRRFLEALGGSEQTRFTQGSGRLELARQIADPSNPFLSRVMVNRVWQHLFGRGIVPTPDDFGALGQPPTNLELLDWLANWYRTDGVWSTKKLIRLLVTSRTYGMSSRPADPLAEEKDPQNLLLHRMPVRRLEGEAIRDAILTVSGQLDPKMFGPPVPVYLTSFMDGRGRPASSGPLDGGRRRSIYQEVRRNFLPPLMRAFDYPVPYTTIGKRTASNVPAQSLVLMNDPFVIGEAQAWAKALLARRDLSPRQRITLMYETIFSRPPAAGELADALAFLDQQGEACNLQPAQRASAQPLWADLCHVLMNVKEFVFLN